MSRVAGCETYDVRFPAALRLDGSDAMNMSPDDGDCAANRMIFKQRRR
jgi:hypothetical protein